MNGERAARLHREGRCTKARGGYKCRGGGKNPYDECGPLPSPTLVDTFHQVVYDLRTEREYVRKTRRASGREARPTLGERWEALKSLRGGHLG